MTKEIVTFERVQELAKERGIEVGLLRPGWCLLAMPSRISPNRKMPPLTFATAAQVLEGRKTGHRRRHECLFHPLIRQLTDLREVIQ